MTGHARYPVPRLFAGLTVLFVLAVGAAGMGEAAAADEPDTVTIPLNALNNSGVSGTATLIAQGNQTVVTLDVEGIAGDHPDHIHRSTCSDPEPKPTYPLRDVVLNPANARGESETTVRVKLSELVGGQYLILIHKSPTDISTYVACGNIAAGEEEGDGGEADATAEATTEEASAAEGEAESDGGNADAAVAAAADEGGEGGDAAAADDEGAAAGGGRSTGGTTGTTRVPATGVGTGLTSDATDLMLAVTVGALAATLATGGLALRRREVRQTSRGRRR